MKPELHIVKQSEAVYQICFLTDDARLECQISVRLPGPIKVRSDEDKTKIAVEKMQKLVTALDAALKDFRLL